MRRSWPNQSREAFLEYRLRLLERFLRARGLEKEAEEFVDASIERHYQDLARSWEELEKELAGYEDPT